MAFLYTFTLSGSGFSKMFLLEGSLTFEIARCGCWISGFSLEWRLECILKLTLERFSNVTTIFLRQKCGKSNYLEVKISPQWSQTIVIFLDWRPLFVVTDFGVSLSEKVRFIGAFPLTGLFRYMYMRASNDTSQSGLEVTRSRHMCHWIDNLFLLSEWFYLPFHGLNSYFVEYPISQMPHQQKTFRL